MKGAPEQHQTHGDESFRIETFHRFSGNRIDEMGRCGEAAAGPMLYPTPELPDVTLIQNVRFSTRVRNALNAAGMKTIGEVRESSDDTLLSLPDLGKGSVAHLRETLGLPSTDGVRPMAHKGPMPDPKLR